MKRKFKKVKIKQKIKMIWFNVHKDVEENLIEKHCKSMQKHVKLFLCLKESNLTLKLNVLRLKNKYIMLLK